MKNTRACYESLLAGDTLVNGKVEISFNEDGSLDEYCFFNAPEKWSIKKEQPKPKKLYAYEIIVDDRWWVMFSPDEMKNERRPEYDIEFKED